MTAEDISETANWQTLALAFGVWTVDFGILYAAELIAPGNAGVAWIAVAACLAALTLLGLLWRRPAVRRSVVARLAIGVATFGILLQTLPPLILR